MTEIFGKKFLKSFWQKKIPYPRPRLSTRSADTAAWPIYYGRDLADTATSSATAGRCLLSATKNSASWARYPSRPSSKGLPGGDLFESDPNRIPPDGGESVVLLAGGRRPYHERAFRTVRFSPVIAVVVRR